MIFSIFFLSSFFRCDKVLENDKDNLIKFVGNLYEKFLKVLKVVLSQKLKLDILEIELEDPNAVDPNAPPEGGEKK